MSTLQKLSTAPADASSNGQRRVDSQEPPDLSLPPRFTARKRPAVPFHTVPATASSSNKPTSRDHTSPSEHANLSKARVRFCTAQGMVTEDSPSQPSSSKVNPLRYEKIDLSGISTVWYETSSGEPIASPPPDFFARPGELFVHFYNSGHLVWLYDHRGVWVATESGCLHPSRPSLSLEIDRSGQPLWHLRSAASNARTPG